MNTRLFVTCEHASNAIPDRLKHYFLHVELLNGHQGFDKGAAEVYQAITSSFLSFALKGEYSRLVIDLNRSLTHSGAFSTVTHALSEHEKQSIIAEIYKPFRDKVFSEMEIASRSRMSILHLSIHSFTPELHHKIRDNDIGLLYDPSRLSEARFCQAWRAAMSKVNPRYKIRMNYPYRGISDGHTSFLRKQFNADNYIGVELEMNQRNFADATLSKEMIATIINSLDIMRHQGYLS